MSKSANQWYRRSFPDSNGWVMCGERSTTWSNPSSLRYTKECRHVDIHVATKSNSSIDSNPETQRWVKFGNLGSKPRISSHLKLFTVRHFTSESKHSRKVLETMRRAGSDKWTRIKWSIKFTSSKLVVEPEFSIETSLTLPFSNHMVMLPYPLCQEVTCKTK